MTVALFDLDDTLVDTEAAFRTELARLASPGEPPVPEGTAWEDEPPYVQERRRLIMHRPGFWLELRPLQPAASLLEDAVHLGMEVHVVTKGPAGQPAAWGEKLRWCQVYLPPSVRVMVVQVKHLIRGDLFVDDRPDNVDPWLAAHPEGRAVVPANPLNVGYAHPRAIRLDPADGAGLTRVIELMTQIATRRTP